MNKRILLSSPTMHGDELGYVNEAFERNWIAPLGFNCDAFETEMADYLSGGEKLCGLSLCSGTAGLHLAVKLAGVKRGDIVLCSDMTFSATVNPVVYEGGVPVFIDSERESWNMSPAALELAFQKYPQAKVVVLVHLYGSPAKIDEIREVCRRHNAVLIEDAAEGLSAEYKGKKLGTFGKYNVISFNGNKIITTSGGGMLLTKDEAAREKAFFWATQAREKAAWYQHEEIGYNYRMSNVVAGIGRGQLKHIEEHRELKKKIYMRYKRGFEGLPISMNPYLDCSEPNFWLSCILIDKQCKVGFMDIYNRLNEANAESRPIWKPMHMQPVFAHNDFVKAENSAADEDIFSRGLCLPSDIKMTEEEQAYVIDAVKSCFK